MTDDHAQRKKHPCPDCRSCGWCAESRCRLCRGWVTEKGKDAPLCEHRPQSEKDDDDHSEQ